MEHNGNPTFTSAKGKGKKALADILLGWSASYLLISVIALAMLVFSSRKYSEALRNEMEYSNSILAESMQMQIDEAIGELRIFGSKATLNAMVNKLRQRTSYEDISRYELYELVQELGNNMVTGADLQRSFLYFPEMDFLVSGRYYNTSRDYYQIAMTGYGFSYSDWYDIISRTYKNPQVFQLACRDGSYKIVLIRPVDSRTRQTYPVNAVMVLDFGQMLSRPEKIIRDGNQICVVDQHNARVISEYGISEALGQMLLSEPMVETYGNLFLQAEDGPLVVTYIRSRFEAWNYVVITPQQLYVKKTVDLQRMVIVICTLYLAASLVIVLQSLRKHYRPIRKMIDVLELEADEPGEGGSSYEYLSSSVTRLMNKNKENSSKILSQYQAIRKELLRRLVTAEKSYDMPDRMMLEQYGIVMDEGSCLVLSYRLESGEEILTDEAAETEHDGLLWFILANVTEEHLKEQGVAVSSVPVKNLLVFIVQSEEHETMLEKTKKAVQMTGEFVAKCFHVTYRAAISEVHEAGMEAVGEAYRQTKRVFEYQKNTVYAGIISYGDINILPTDTMLKYPLEVENRLFHSILAGEEEKACEIIADLLKENQYNCLTPAAMQFLVSNIASTIIRAVNRISRGRGGEPLSKQVMEVCALNDVKLVQKELESIVRHACTNVKAMLQEEKSSQKVTLYEAVKTYVADHYADPAVSVNEIAGQYELSPAALSKLFKEAGGENLSQYINQVRLKEAKALLMQGIRLEEVAQRCGYGSQRTFLRIFKQYLGVTPSQYRGLEEKKNEEH